MSSRQIFILKRLNERTQYTRRLMQKSQLSWKTVRELAKTQSLEEIKQSVLTNYKNVGIQQHEDLLMFSINNPTIVVESAIPEDTYAIANRRAKREMATPSQVVNDDLVEQTVGNLAGSSFVYNTNDNTVKHRFLRTSRALDDSEIAHFKIDPEKKGKSNFIKMEAVPYGLMFQAVYINDKWILASPNNCHLNTKTFGSTVTVIDKFEQMLKVAGFSLESLKQTSVYTFILGCNEFSVFQLKKEYLILRSIFTADQSENDTESDTLIKLREPVLKPFLVNLDNKSFTLVQNILKSRRQSWFYTLLEEGIPINYFIGYHDKIFQFSTPLFDKLWKYYSYMHLQTEHVTLPVYLKSTFKTELTLPEYLLSSKKIKPHVRNTLQKTQNSHNPTGKYRKSYKKQPDQE